MRAPQTIIRVAIKTPIDHLFDYLPPAATSSRICAGMRVRVPFGRGETVGVIVGVSDRSDIAMAKLRPVSEILDDEPVIDKTLMQLLGWAAAYYQQSPGEVYAAALPKLLRSGRAVEATRTVWSITRDGAAVDLETLRRRAPRQAVALTLLTGRPAGADAGMIDTAMGDGWRPVLRKLQNKNWVAQEQQPVTAVSVPETALEAAPVLTADQENAVATILENGDSFGSFLLNGITGSGKTEVYLQVIAELLETPQQALVLVPEIGLTPQLVDRFRRRLGIPITVLHSALTEAERLAAWRAARDGSARVIVGTRSAVFAPMAAAGVIIVDEEHDTSYKQQEGFRYSARDLAVLRARRHDIPVLLGSATPSLESLHNVAQGRYRQLDLNARPGSAELPTMRLVDMRREPIDSGFSGSLINAMRRHLQNSGQVLLFLNRRGFAPAWFCADCGWIALCKRCDARMTLHQKIQRLRCHHCGAERLPEPACPQCETAPQPVGLGTERVEENIARLFPGYSIARIDRDSTRARGSLENLLQEIHRGKRQILIGTQMLTKGHHFPDVTLVGIVDADQGLFGTDPRSNERLAQLIVQVAGRAGRADKPGEVLIQTQCPEHPLLNLLILHGYAKFAEAALAEREAAGWPPYSALALLRADSEKETLPQQFLSQARGCAGNIPGIEILGPTPAPMPRRAGRYRAQLLIQGARKPLQLFLKDWRPRLARLEHTRRVRWSLDVDPIELF